MAVSLPLLAGGSNACIEEILDRYPHMGLILDDGSEVSGTGYARVDTTSLFPATGDGSGQLSNNSDIVFTNANVDWTVSPRLIKKFRLYDAATGGTAGYEDDFDGLQAGELVVQSGTISLRIASGNATIRANYTA